MYLSNMNVPEFTKENVNTEAIFKTSTKQINSHIPFCAVLW